jgi:aminoglycoside phosphotransferase (APT) family kinase protein
VPNGGVPGGPYPGTEPGVNDQSNACLYYPMPVRRREAGSDTLRDLVAGRADSMYVHVCKIVRSVQVSRVDRSARLKDAVDKTCGGEMSIGARYQPGAVRSPFVNRKEIIAAFAEEIERLGQRPRLIELSGVGGIGKSRLLHELRRRAPDDVVTALLNLQEPEQRSALPALGMLRSQFGAAGVRFDRFDVAYAVWWQRLNPMVPLSVGRLPWAAESEVLASVLDEFMLGVPVVATAVKVLDVAARKFKRWNTIRHDQTLRELDEMSVDRLGDAVAYLFAGDLNVHGRYVLFVDAYEALVGGVSREGSVALVDAWLRDLLGQLDHGLVVVASREPLGWHRHEPEWAKLIRSLRVGALPYQARLELLHAMGVEDPAALAAIARECDGVPFFLHLAHESGSAARRYARVEERFLRHVPPDMVKILQLLSVARVFDRDIFRQVARHYELRTDAQVWEALIAYSFIATAGADTLQMHQLMSRAVQARLSPDVLRELHELLRDIWRERALGAPSIVAWREAAFHAACSDPADPVALLEYADYLAANGRPGLDDMCADLKGIDSGRFRRITKLIAAEASLLVGDAHGVQILLNGLAPELPEGADEIDARTALAAANAERILGNTEEALRRYGEIWPGYPGSVRLDAGTWHADLDMAQGRFIDAVATADEVERDCLESHAVLRADLARLRSLAHRFAFDLPGASRHLAVARAGYAAAGHRVGMANITTNEAEILAMTDPAAAVAVAAQAIETQLDLGAGHEAGKALTALALARLGRGDLDGCGQVLDEATTILDHVGYRSGRARAELIRALWHARLGRREQAAASVTWAVAELEAAAVYPTMVLLAGTLLDRIGLPVLAVSAAVTRAEEAMQPLGDLAELERSIVEFVARLVPSDWDDVVAVAMRERVPLAGFYHHNIRAGANLVRIPIPDADRMDLHIWPEPQVLAAVGRHLDCVPRLRCVSRRPPYQIHEWVDGTVLDDTAPKGTRVPEGAIDQIASFVAALAGVPLAELPPLPSDWPVAGDSAGFAARLLAITHGVYHGFHAQYAAMWRALGIPDDPFEPLELHLLAPRPFRLLHTDVHRKNIIVRLDGTLVFVDWELALAGDPVYELAVHLHKMAYQPDEDESMLHAWVASCGAAGMPGWSADLDRYLAHERVKSAIVDSVRYAKVVAADPAQLNARAANLALKLALARAVWQDPRPVDVAELAALLAG